MDVIIVSAFNVMTACKLSIFVFFSLTEAVLFKKHTGEELGVDPFKVIEVGTSRTVFYNVPKERPMVSYTQLHVPFIVEKLFHLQNDIEYVSGSVKFVIRPFKEVYMVKNGIRTLIGRFTRSFIDNDDYYQVFKDGDKCSYKSSVRWSAKVHFLGGINDLKVVKLIEGKLCKYSIKVTGDILTRRTEHASTVFYRSSAEKQSSENENEHAQ